MEASLPLRCRCGQVQGLVEHPETGTRAICYCSYCQAFAHFLGAPESVLDALGGTDILAMQPRFVRFTQGADQLACMSLTGRTYRWYAACCQTPIGNTPRDPHMAHVGLIHSALAVNPAQRDAALGPVRMHVGRKSAHGTAPNDAMSQYLMAILRYLARSLWARVSGTYRSNPFFNTDSGKPIVEPRLLSRQESQELRRRAMSK